MTNQKNESATDRYPISLLPECAWLWSNTDLRDRLLTYTLEAHESSERAKELVSLHILGRIPYHGGGSEFLRTLLSKGYTREAVAQALADAWLGGFHHFELPRQSRWSWVHKFWGQLVLSLFMTIVLVGLAMKIIADISPQIDLYLMAFPPLLSIVSLLVLTVMYLFISSLISWWSSQKLVSRSDSK
jgi:hypothetical protein